MRTSRITHLIALLCFLPTVAGCTKTNTVNLSTDPDASASGFSEGDERIRISGYLAEGNDHRDWEGHVSFVPPDSLRFEPLESAPSPKPATFGGSPAPPDPDPIPFTLPVDAVTSIDAVEANYAGAVLLAASSLLLFAAVAITAVGLSGGYSTY